jgi:hypothetical protein
MNKYTAVFLFGSGVLLGISHFFRVDDRIPIYIAALILIVVPIYFFADFEKRKLKEDEAEKIMSTMNESHLIRMAQKEVKSKIPKNSPRRESPAAFEGSTKLGSTRSMAVLIRKPRLREKILEICDFADMVLETIRRMPADTPAAVEFAEKHLSKLNEALERCFEMSRCEEYRHAPASLDAQELECFSAFITIFRKQQDNILFEGRD